MRLFACPVAAKVGVVPETGFPFASRRVTVTVAFATPSAFKVLGATASVDCEEDGLPEMKLTVPPVFETGVFMESVLVSAFLDLRVQVDIPLASLLPQAE